MQALGIERDWQAVQDLAPCEAMIVVLSRGARYQLGGWLRGVADLVVIVDERDPAAQGAPATANNPVDDPDLVALDDSEIEDALGVRPSLTWDGTAWSIEAIKATIAELNDRARGRLRLARGPREPSAHLRVRARARAQTTSQPSTVWREVHLERWTLPRIRSRITLHEGRIVIVEDGAGPSTFDTAGSAATAHAGHAAHVARITDIENGTWVTQHVPHAQVDGDVAFSVDGRCLVRRNRDNGSLDLFEVGRAAVAASVPTRNALPFGVEVDAHLAAAGWRCTFDWYRIARRSGADGWEMHELCGCAHDWPVGHAKKLYGHDDNHPRHVAIAPDGGAYVSTFEHDAIVAGALPFRWRRASLGSSGRDVALLDWPPEDSLRKLFFVADWTVVGGGISEAARSEAAREEDARGHAPVVVVGPGDDTRYAIALDEEVWTLSRDDEASVVGGPHEGYAIFDASHRVVRRGRGRLLGGDHEALLVHLDGELWREDFITGDKTSFGPETSAIAEAHAIAGRFVLVAPVDEGSTTAPVRVRLA